MGAGASVGFDMISGSDEGRGESERQRDGQSHGITPTETTALAPVQLVVPFIPPKSDILHPSSLSSLFVRSHRHESHPQRFQRKTSSRYQHAYILQHASIITSIIRRSCHTPAIQRTVHTRQLLFSPSFWSCIYDDFL